MLPIRYLKKLAEYYVNRTHLNALFSGLAGELDGFGCTSCTVTEKQLFDRAE